jgi:hypothetical protein
VSSADGGAVSFGTGSFGERDAGYVAEIWNPKTGVWATPYLSYFKIIEFKRLCGAYKGLVQVQRYRRLTANHLLGALDIAEAMSVREKSLPLKSSGKFSDLAIAYEKQSPKFKAAACRPFPYFKKAAIAISI